MGFSDDDYRNIGAQIASSASEVFEKAEMIVKVKEPLTQERAMLRPDQILFTYLHLAPDLAQTQDLIKSKAVCIAYETVTSDNGSLPFVSTYVRSGWTHVYSSRRSMFRKISCRSRYAARWCTWAYHRRK
ncbi:MAG: hypothetical protein Q9M92_12230 [Enterobacterales bacterium]|nr:hypothetical protein [Enterobacterales bacterium]